MKILAWFGDGRLEFLLIIFGAILSIILLIKFFLIKYGKKWFAFLKSVFFSMLDGFIRNEDVRRILNKHPRFFTFVKHRLSRKNFSGLTLTLLSIALIYFAISFAGVLFDVMNTQIIKDTDIHIASLLFSFRNVILTKLFLSITLLGSVIMVVPATIVFCAILVIWKKKEYLLPFGVTIIGSEAANFLIKLWIDRPRPDVAFYIEKSSAFPSAHALTSIALYGFIAYFFIANAKKWKVKLNIFFSFLILSLLIGFSRLYLGVHFFTDVWGGYLLGLCWFIIGIMILKYHYFRRGEATAIHLSRKAKIRSVCLVIIFLIFFVFQISLYQPEYNILGQANVKQIDYLSQDIFERFKLPKYTETLTGISQEPISIVLSARDDESLVRDFESAGWQAAAPINFSTAVDMGYAALLNKSYDSAPMTPSFWNAEVHDFGFEKSTAADSVRSRHHARFWKTNLRTRDGKSIYVGTVSLDVGIKWALVHRIDPNIDGDRDLLFNDLSAANEIVDSKKEKLVEPFLGKNFVGDMFFTDGSVYLLELK
ncbi:LssY C-terminal domain-containing protein [Patescibacteria group bacterium]|nr:LssY C-terminal domain-containing protein [Patescibacteria group bacterium]